MGASIAAQKVSVNPEIIEKSCLGADETIDKLTLVYKQISATNDALQADMVGEMYVNFGGASFCLEDKIRKAQKFIQRTNDNARWEVGTAPKIEQHMGNMLGGLSNS